MKHVHPHRGVPKVAEVEDAQRRCGDALGIAGEKASKQRGDGLGARQPSELHSEPDIECARNPVEVFVGC